MKIFLILIILSAAFVNFGCSFLPKYGNQNSSNTASNAANSVPSSTPTPAPTATIESEATPPNTEQMNVEPNLLSFANAALIRQLPSQYGNWEARQMFDDSPKYGWASDKEKTTNQVTVIELPAKTTFSSFSFDTANVDTENSSAKDLTVEISNTSATDGFQNILTATLENKKDNQRFKASSETPGRWVRLTVKNNYGSADYTEIMEFRGFGTQEPQPPLENISGTYSSSYGDFHVKQEGTSVIGCYEYNSGLIDGGIDGRVMSLTWRENEDHKKQGPAVMIFSTDGKEMVGLWKYDKDEKFAGEWNGKKISQNVGSCPQLPNLSKGNAAQANIEKSISETGRARVYGINFDTNSDVIREESKSTLNQIAAMLKEKADWKMTIEGHTDNVGGEKFNQGLSERRADSVKNYLVKAGIDETRLNSAGFGLSKPVAPNDSETGRAQNRRVELVKQ